MSKNFHVYLSSAGSGKTYMLTLSYLKLALRGVDAFKHILAVTFTNKATEEMKERILQVLRGLASGDAHPMKKQLMDDLKMSEEGLKTRAEMVLRAILHEYGRFSIVTIDSFFHQVIRSFAREMGLQGTFRIDLDIDKVLQEVVDNMLAKLGEDNQTDLRKWLTQFAEEKLEDGKSWDFRSDITSLANEIFRDGFKSYGSQIFELSKSGDFFTKKLKSLQDQRTKFERDVQKLAKEGIAEVDRCGGIDQFTRKASGPAGLFAKVLGGDYDVSDTRRMAADDVTKWLTKANLGNATLVDGLESAILPLYKKMIHYLDEHLLHINSILEVYRFFHTYGILSALNQELQHYRDEKDIMLISDLPDFLRQIINDSDTPFIYEKIGGIFQHYLIDEFQDTSGFQWQNFKPLLKNALDSGETSMVVGDTKQSIYRWRGGDWKLLNSEIMREVGEHHSLVHRLSSNWRSDGRIVGFNNWLFQKMPDLIAGQFADLDVELESHLLEFQKVYTDAEQQIEKPGDSGGIHCEFINQEDDWKTVAVEKTISTVEELQRKGFDLRDIAILTRTTGEGKLVADSFIKHKHSDAADPALSYEVVSSEALYLYSGHVVQFIVSMLRWMNDEEDLISLAEWFHEYQVFIKEIEVEGSPVAMVREWEQHVPKPFVRHRANIKSLPLYDIVESLIRIFELNEIRAEITYLQGFQDAVLDFTKNEGGDISAFLEWWENVRKDRAIQIADENNAVKVLTIHKSKGLEYPVVIVPFLNWKLDHDVFGNSEVLWMSPDVLDMDDLPVVPIRYSSKLKDTYWSHDYWKERTSAFLDSLNLLYVAFTRPIKGLYVFGPKPKTSKMSDVADLCFDLFATHENWDIEKEQLNIGEISPSDEPRKGSSEYSLAVYASQPWRSKISVQMKGAAELSDKDWDKQLSGTDMHKVLSEVEEMTPADIPDWALDFMQSEEVRPYFENLDEVRKEVPILMPGGNFYRIDRLIRKGKEWTVIDFKTGTPRDKDEDQVRTYLKILNTMGYQQVVGVLIYLDPVLVKSVA